MNDVEKFVDFFSSRKTDDEKGKAIAKMIETNQPTVSELLSFAHHPNPNERRRRLLPIMKILALIEYPKNQKAIPLLVSEASKINSSTWELAIDTLLKIGEPTVPAIREALTFYMRDCYEYGLEIQGLCILIEQMDEVLVEAILPELMLLLKSGNDENFVGVYALGCINKIKTSKLNAAIPILSDIISSSKDERIKISSLDLLEKFDFSRLHSIVQTLLHCLNDKSEIVRSRTQKLIEKIQDCSQ